MVTKAADDRMIYVTLEFPKVEFLLILFFPIFFPLELWCLCFCWFEVRTIILSPLFPDMLFQIVEILECVLFNHEYFVPEQ